ncbi:MAG TPA: DUF2628 domain-containing protein [Acetobacteraceae bacterium]|jgi:hypothetical protein
MTFWTAHIRSGHPPALVREGFSWGAFCFGPIWLAAHRAWVPAALALAAFILILALVSAPDRGLLLLALAIVLGLSGQDLRRWSMQHRGFTLAQVVVARSEPEALGVLLSRRPDLTGSFLPPGSAR